MRVNDLGSPKILALACLAIMVLLGYLNRDNPAQPAVLSGVVAAIQAQDGMVRGLAVESQGQRYAVSVLPDNADYAKAAALALGQEVELSVSNMRAVKRGLVCQLAQVLKAGAVLPGYSAPPQGNGRCPSTTSTPPWASKACRQKLPGKRAAERAAVSRSSKPVSSRRVISSILRPRPYQPEQSCTGR